MKPLAPFWVTVVLLTSTLTSSTCRAQELSPAEAALLPKMDDKTMREVMELSRQINDWREEIDRIRKRLEEAKKNPGDSKLVTDASDALLKITRRLQPRSALIRDYIGLEKKIDPLVRRLADVAKGKLSAKDLPGANAADRAKARIQAQASLVKQIADALEKDVFDRVKSLRNPAQFATRFIEQKLKKEYFNKHFTFGGFTLQIDQKDFSTSVFSDKANIAVVVVRGKSGAKVKARGLYFKYKYPIPEPVTSKLTFEVFEAEDLVKKVEKYLPPIGPIRLDKDVPITVDRGKDGKVSKTRFGILIDFTKLEDVGLGKLVSVKAKVAVSASGGVTVEAAKGRAPLVPPVPLGQTTLLITEVWVGVPANTKNKIELGMRLATVADKGDTLYADITATVGFPIAKEGIALDGSLNLNTTPLGHVTGFINKDRLTVTMDSKAITGGTGALTIKGTITRQGLDASAQFNSLFGLANASGNLHLGADGKGSLSVSSRGPLGANVSLGASFSPGFKNLVFKGAASIDLADPYLGTATAEVDIKGQLLPSPKLTAWGHIGPIDFPSITLNDRDANFNKLIDELKRKLLDARQQFYKFLADVESKASKYADERTQVFAGWIYQNAKSIGLDKFETGNPMFDKAMGNVAQNLKDGGGAISQFGKDTGKATADAVHHGEEVLSNIKIPGFGLRSATVSTGASGGFGLTDLSSINKKTLDSAQKNLRTQVLRAQLAHLTKSLEQVVVHREKSLGDKSNKTGQVAELRMRTSNVLPHAKGDRDADLSLLVQVTSLRYTIDPKKGLAGKIEHTSNLYVAGISLQNLVGKGRKPTAQVNLPALKNVAPWDAVRLLRDELMKRIDTQLGSVQLTNRFEERRLLLHNLTAEPITAHVQIETKMGQSWRWLPAGPGTSFQSMSVAVPPRKIVPVTIDKDRMAQGRRARIWASSPSGRVWMPYASRDVALVQEKDEQGHTGYYGQAVQNFRFWFSAPAAKTTTLHERLVSVRNNTRYPLLVTVEAAVGKENGKLEWREAARPTRIQPEATAVLHSSDNLPLRGTAIRFRAEDEKKQSYRWVSTWNKLSGQVDAKGYSAASLGTTLLVLEPPGRRPSSTGSSTSANVIIHVPAEQVTLPATKNMPAQQAKTHLEEKPNKPPPDNRVLAPNFKGMTLADAEAEGRRGHLVVKADNAERIPTRKTKDKNLVGKTIVEEQGVPAGTKMRRNSRISVTLVRYIADKPSKPQPQRK